VTIRQEEDSNFLRQKPWLSRNKIIRNVVKDMCVYSLLGALDNDRSTCNWILLATAVEVTASFNFTKLFLLTTLLYVLSTSISSL